MKKGEELKKKIRVIEAENAVQILKENIANTRHVKVWALHAGCSKTKLNQLMTIQFKLTAKAVLKNTRLEAIKETIAADLDLGSYAVACECGLQNEQELYKFLTRNFETSFTELRAEILLSGQNG